MKTVKIHPLSDDTRELCYVLLQRHQATLQQHIEDIKHDIRLFEEMEMTEQDNLVLQADIFNLRKCEYELKKVIYAIHDVKPYEKEKPL